MKAGWQRTTLGVAFSTITGGTPPKGDVTLYGDFLPFVKPPELLDSTVDAAEDSLSEAGAEVARVLPKDSIMISCIGNLGKVGLNTVPVAFNQQINAILPDESKATPWFLFYQALSCRFRDQLESQASGTTVRIVNKSKFNNIEIVLPPLQEQHRIVAILDETFDGIATAKANAEQNLQNARALFESHLQAVFTERGEGWLESTLGKSYDVRDGTHDSPRFYDEGYPLVTSKNLKREGLNLEDVRLISEADYCKINERSKVDVGDVLFAMIGTIGNPVVVREKPYYAIKNMALFKVPGTQDSDFLRYFLNAEVTLSRMKQEANGTTQKFVGLGYLRNFPIAVPPLQVQRQVVNDLMELDAETQRLESLYRQKLAALDELKKSLLHQAFSGQL